MSIAPASRIISAAFLTLFFVGAAGIEPAFAQPRIRSDFNGDGIDDLAIGVPGEKAASGGVNIIYGTPNGLASTGNAFFSQAGDVPDAPEANDNCGAALAVGFFNNDAFADLAMGCPGEDIGTAANMGGVNILYGSAAGLTVTGSQFFGFTDTSPGALSFEDKCATALTSGDFNGDGHDDLAMGCPGREFGVTVEGGGVNNAGRVIVLFGTASGLTASGRLSLTQATTDVPDTPEAEDGCGSALAAGLFNRDAFSDLAIGCPGEDVSGNSDLGGVNVLPGSSTGPTGTNSQFLSFSDLAAGEISLQDRCGSALAVGDFNNDDIDDLAMGCPGREIGATVEGGGVFNVGRVIALNGSTSGITATGRVSFTQNTPNVPDSGETNDSCGASVATGDFNGDGFSDLIMGCPLEDVGNNNDFGGVNAIYGSAAGLTATTSQFFGFTDFTSFADRCSTGLASGDFNRDGIDDLAIGCPGFDLDVVLGEAVFGTFDAGRVIVLNGSAARLTTTGRLSFTQDTTGIAGTAQEGDAFGFALAGMGGFAAPGLTAAWESVSQSCNGSGRCRLSGNLSVINPSTQSVPPTVLRVYLSTDAVLDASDVLLQEAGVGALKNGETMPRHLNVLLPEGVDATGHFVIAFVDADDIVDETNEANNIVVFGPIQ